MRIVVPRPAGRRASLGMVLAALAVIAVPRAAFADVPLRSDFNGDGFDDLVVALPGYQVGNVPDAGAFFIVPGGANALVPQQARQLWHRGVEGVPGVQTRDERWGLVLLTADFNGDGFFDLAIGSPVAVVDSVPNRGDVVVLYGSRDGLAAANAVHLTPDAALGAAFFGASLATGQFNLDPLPDLAVGAPGANDGAGAVVVHQTSFNRRMSVQTVLTADMAAIDDPAKQSEAVAFGAALAVGAFNAIGTGPGLDDLAIASRQRDRGGVAGAVPGRVYIAHGGANPSTRGLGFAAPAEYFDLDDVSGLVPDGALYAAYLAPGDLDGDGFDDLTIALPTAGVATPEGDLARAGAVVIMFGAADGFAADRARTLVHSDVGFRDEVEAGDEFATTLVVGDLDDDGFADIIIGTPFEDDLGDTDAGNINVVYGIEGGLDLPRHATLNHEMTYYPLNLGQSIDGGMFGASLGMGDFNGDGFEDLVIGIPGRSGPGGVAHAGWLLMVRGSTQGVFTAASVIIRHQTLTELDLPLFENDYLGLAVGGGTATCPLAGLCMRLR